MCFQDKSWIVSFQHFVWACHCASKGLSTCGPDSCTWFPQFHSLSSSWLKSFPFFLWELPLFCLPLKMDTFCSPRPTVFSVLHTFFGDVICWCLLFFYNVDHFKVFIEFVITWLLFYVLVFWPQGMWEFSCPTRDWTCTPCTGRRSLSHWIAREVPADVFNTAVCWLPAPAFPQTSCPRQIVC